MAFTFSFFCSDELEEEVEEQTNEKKGKYAEFWKQYGKFIKMGILDDTTNGKRLAKLLRFQRYPFMHDASFNFIIT
jgi:heat shock protein beta